MKHIKSWDFFAPNHRSDIFRSVMLLASQIAENEQFRVRLFIDDLNPLVPMSPRIDTSLWIQAHREVTLAKLDLAAEIEPANNIVRLFGSKLPRRYVERATFGQGLERRFFHIKLLDQSGTLAPTPANPASTHLQFIDVLQGDSPPARGLIRDRHNLPDLRSKWRAQRTLSHATLQAIGLGHIQTADALVICCWRAQIKNFHHFLEVLGHASQRPLILLLEPGQESEQIQSLANGWPDQGSGQREARVQVLALPLLSWAQLDEVVWISAFVMTGDDDMAQRAIESGAPLMWLPHQKDDARTVSRLAEWYFETADRALSHRIQALTLSVLEGTPASGVLRRYIDQCEDVERLAGEISKRVARAPLLSQVLPELPYARSIPANMSQPYLHPYVATMPLTVPGNDDIR